MTDDDWADAALFVINHIPKHLRPDVQEYLTEKWSTPTEEKMNA